MHRLLVSAFLAIAMGLGAAPAQAGILTSATWTQVVEGVPITRTTAQLGATGVSTGGGINVSISFPAFSTQFFTTTPFLYGPLNLHVKFTQAGAQDVLAAPSMAAGIPNIQGMLTILTAIHVGGTGPSASMLTPGMQTWLRIPFQYGTPGQFTTSHYVFGILHYTTVDFYGWTPHTRTFTGLTHRGLALPNVVAKGSFALNSNGAGTVTLVSPTKISINGGLLQRRTASFATLKLSFVPEPGAALLLAAGGLALLAFFRRRMRRA